MEKANNRILCSYLKISKIEVVIHLLVQQDSQKIHCEVIEHSLYHDPTRLRKKECL